MRPLLQLQSRTMSLSQSIYDDIEGWNAFVRQCGLIPAFLYDLSQFLVRRSRLHIRTS